MHKPIALLVSLAIGLAGLSSARAQDEPRAIVEKAVKAMGGLDKLSKHKAAHMKHKGTVDAMGVSADYTADMWYQNEDQFKQDISVEVMGMKIKVIQVLNKDKGWASIAGMTTELMGDQLDAMKNEVYANGVESVYPLLMDKDKRFTLSLVGEEKVNDKPAIGIRVSCKDQKDINLYFDKESGLVVKSARWAKDFSGAMDVDQTSYYSDYKEVSGVKTAMKFLVQHDGKKVIEGEFTEVKYVDKIDDAEFSKP